VLASRASVADRELAAAEVVRSLPETPKGSKAENGSDGSSQQRHSSNRKCYGRRTARSRVSSSSSRQ